MPQVIVDSLRTDPVFLAGVPYAQRAIDAGDRVVKRCASLPCAFGEEFIEDA